MADKTLKCICIDASEHSERAFNWYVQKFHRDGDVVGLLHVHQIPDLPVMGSMDYSMAISETYQSIMKSSLQESRELLEKYEDKCKEKGFEYKVIKAECQTSPGQVICNLAKKSHADAIIMGQRGLNTIRRMLLGSTSDYVVHHAHIPVTVVPNDS